MYCSHCGKELIETALMCPNCGALTKNAPPIEETLEAENNIDESAKKENDELEATEEEKDENAPQNPFFVPGLVPPKLPESYLEDMQNAAVNYGVIEFGEEPVGKNGKKKKGKAQKSKDKKLRASTSDNKSQKHGKWKGATIHPATLAGYIMSALGFLFGFILISLILAERGSEAFLSISLAIVNITLIPALIGFILSVFGFCRKNTDLMDNIMFIFSSVFSGLLVFYYFIALCVGIA